MGAEMGGATQKVRDWADSIAVDAEDVLIPMPGGGERRQTLVTVYAFHEKDGVRYGLKGTGLTNEEACQRIIGHMLHLW